MRAPRLTLGTILIPLVGLGIPLLGSLVAALAFPEQHWSYHPLHIVVEGIGAVIAVGLSVLLLILRRYRDVPPYQRWIACALLGMGLLDGLHALSMPGETFVWLRSMATLVGGFFFALIGLPDRVVRSMRGWVVPGMVAGGALTLGLASILFPEIIPRMVVQGSFTPAARTLNILGGLFFLVAATRLTVLYRSSGGGDEFLFAIHCALFGAAGLLFDSSELWDAGWWWWHLIRLTSYCVVLRYLVATYHRTKDVVSPYALLPALIIVVTVLALAIGAVALRYVEARLVAMTGESLTLASAEIADKLDRVLFERSGDIQMMARVFGLRPHGQRELTAYLNWMKTSYRMYLWIGVTDERGRVVAAADEASVGIDKSRTGWFRAVREGLVVHVGDVEVSEESNGQDAVEFSAPIIGPRGEFLGTVSMRVGLPDLENVSTQTIRTVEAQQEFLGTVEYQFLTRAGNVFIDSDLAHKGNVNLKHMGLPSAFLTESARSGYIEEEHLRRHVSVVTGYARTKGDAGLLWGVLVRRDRSDILAPIRQVLLKLSAAGAVVWLPMLGLLFWSTRRVRIEYAKTRQESARARAAEASMRESEQRFRTLTSQAPVGIFMTDAQGDCLFVNRQWSEIAGLSLEEAQGRGWVRAVHPDDRERVFQEWYEAAKEGRQFASAYRFQRPDGTVTHLEGSAVKVAGAAGEATAYIGTIVDTTTRKQAEKRQAAQLAVSLVLAESGTLTDAAPKLLQAVCDTTGWELGAIWRVDRTAKVLRCETVWHLPSVRVEEFVTLSLSRTFMPGVGLPGRVWESGQPAWIPDVIKDPNFPRAPVAARVGLHGAFGFPILLGQDVLGVLEFFSSEIRQPDLDLLSMMADIGIKVGQFITLQQLEEQLRQSQKMEAIGQLAGGVAHDFNNLLTVIKGYSQFLLSRVEPDSSLRRDIEEIQKAGDRAAELTRQLLAFSRRQVLAPKVLNLNEVLASIEGMLRRLIGEDVAMVTVLSPSLGLAKADPGQLEQVIVNLVVNARDAMPQGGKLTIETTNVEFNGVHSGKQVTIPPGRYVVLAVSDIGCGMDTATQARIFEPFFTTKEKGKGTGLGLATVYGIVKQSSGYITVYSEPGRGATFKVYLPRVEAPVAPAEPVAPRRAVTMSLDGSEMILLVEDEDTIRALACGTLRSYGYRVLEARGAAEALRLSQERADPIHLLLTDVVMPQGSGRELAERLASLRPDMKVLYMSGYTDDAVVRHGVLQEGTAFLQKPFTPDVLARKVREVLDTPPQAASTASSD